MIINHVFILNLVSDYFTFLFVLHMKHLNTLRISTKHGLYLFIYLCLNYLAYLYFISTLPLNMKNKNKHTNNKSTKLNTTSKINIIKLLIFVSHFI